MGRFIRLTMAVTLLGACTEATAQPADAPPFEAASIKPQLGDPAFVPSSPDRFVDVNATLRSLIAWAYDLRNFQIEGGPDWTNSRRFDVSARAPRAVPQSTMRLMVQRLLTERFQLRTHIEARQMPVYVLRTARGGATLGERLKRAAIDCSAILGERMGAPPPDGSGGPVCAWRVGITPPVARMFVDGAPMREFAGLLERLLGRKVLDETGLTGTFDVRLEFDSEQLPVAAPIAPDQREPPRDGLSLFTALEEQLGLRLESGRGGVDVLVIDGAELPTPD